MHVTYTCGTQLHGLQPVTGLPKCLSGKSAVMRSFTTQLESTSQCAFTAVQLVQRTVRQIQQTAIHSVQNVLLLGKNLSRRGNNCNHHKNFYSFVSFILSQRFMDLLEQVHAPLANTPLHEHTQVPHSGCIDHLFHI
jgi:hypothetical protein